MNSDHPRNWDDDALLALALDPITPRPGIRAKLMRRIDAEAEYRPAVSIRAGGGQWVSAGLPGVAIQDLYTDEEAGRKTFLVRMDPGTTVPEHRHIDAEQGLVLEGDLRWEDLEYGAGDFMVAKAGSVHPPLSTRAGNVLFIVAGTNELMSA